MRQAKSRLSNSKKKTKKSQTKSTRKSSRAADLSKSYLSYLPTLIIGLFFAALTYFLLTSVDPEKIKHVVLPHTYLPFLISVFLSLWFLVSFVLLNTRRGLLLSLLATIILFLRLQQVIINTQLIFYLLLPAAATELVFILLSKITNKQA